jgi:hypothetical protein
MLIYINKLLRENTTYYNITSKMATEMKKPEPFYIDSSKMYYNNTDLFNYDQIFYYGCKTKPKTIVIKKKIPESEYLYANLKKGDWNLSSSECKKSQLLISKEWVDKYYFKIDDRKEPTIIPKPVNIVFEETNELEESNVTILEEEQVKVVEELTNNEEILEAPKILLLDDSEKFKDADGNVIEIETRGTKDRKNIYFKCKDISVGFGMTNLNSILLQNHEYGYEINKHYKTFLVKTNNNAFIKSLYLTYYGFLRVINCSRKSKIFVQNINIITKWLDYLINNKYFDNYIISNVNQDLSGVIYICSSPLIDCIKIGYWTGSISGLKSRYKMVYGKDVILNCKNVENVRDKEKEIHSVFKQFNISGELFQKDKLHLYNDYLNNNIVEYLDRNFKEDCGELDEDLDDEFESNNDENENENDTIEQVPRILLLDDREKFRDTDGNIVSIETRGTKSYNDIYFKLTDVSKGFNMENLRNSIQKKNRGYVRNDDYKTFLIRGDNVPSTETNKNNKTSLYLTYNGLVKVLMVSRNKNVKRFQEWAIKTLFTIQMGTKEDKVELGTKILGIPEKTYSAVFNKHANDLPAIYLCSLGHVKELRNTFEIDNSFPDDSVVYKYGFTENLADRMQSNKGQYEKLENVKFVLTTFNGIDPQYLRDAERDVKEECNAYEINLQTKGYKELIILNEAQLKNVKKNYGRLGRDYAGHSAELQQQIRELKEELLKVNYENERLKTLVESNEKYHKLELKNKDLKIENLELKLLTSNIK